VEFLSLYLLRHMMINGYDHLIPSIQYFIERKDMPSWHLAESKIPYNDLTYLDGGEATYTVNGKAVSLKKGDIIFIPKGSLREAYTNQSNPIHCYAFNFDYQYAEGGYLELSFPQKFNVGMDNELLPLYRQFNHLWLEKEPGYVLKARGLFMIILHRLLILTSNGSAAQISDPKIELVKNHILCHFSDKITVAELAGLAGFHPAYLSARFRKVTGYTVKEYLNRIRINKAFDLLSTKGYSVTDTALICGFDDIFYFSKLFKQLNGFPPSSLLKK
jgi:AraC-like DNA-binding protein